MSLFRLTMVPSKRSASRDHPSKGHSSTGRLMWYLYILRCKDGNLYTGVTTDIPRRVTRHNSKKASKYTRIRTPVTLVYKETYRTRSKALIREAQIKRWSKKKKLALINHNSSQLIELSKSRD